MINTFTPIGELRRICLADPRVHELVAEAPYDWLDGRPIVRGSATSVWVELRRQVPLWRGDDYGASTTYAAGEVVWDQTTGDYYKSRQDSNTGNAVTATTYWERLDFPYILSEAVAQGAYADAVRADGRQELFPIENSEAARLLQQAMGENDRRGGTARRMAVISR